MLFKENICWLNPSGGNEFPDRFENEVYYVDDLQLQNTPYNYISNFSLKYVIRGEETYIVNNKLKRVRDNESLVVNNQSEVSRLTSKGNSFSVFLSPTVLKDCHMGMMNNEEHLLEYPLNEQKNSIELYDEIQTGRLSFMNDLKTRITTNPDLIIPIDYYYEICLNLLLNQNTVFKRINRLDKVKFVTRKELFTRLNKAKHYLDDTLTERFCLDKMSQECALSKYQLIRDFKYLFGITPHRYFIIRKLSKAKEMIKSGRYSTLQEISLELEYPSLSSFSRQFKQIFGFSPKKLLKS
jgi:AraC-like DNA-binding protein